MKFGPFIGFNYWQEEAEAFGARCNRDDVAGAFCGPPGSIVVPFSTKVITNQASWAALRLGAEMKVRLWDRLSFIGDAAVLPAGYLWKRTAIISAGISALAPMSRIRASAGATSSKANSLRQDARLVARQRRALLVRRDQWQHQIRA